MSTLDHHSKHSTNKIDELYKSFFGIIQRRKYSAKNKKEKVSGKTICHNTILTLAIQLIYLNCLQPTRVYYTIKE